MDKPKRKGYSYHKADGYHQKRSRQLTLEAGMSGFLCTCNFREKECIRDAYRILEEFANELYGTNDKSQTNDKDNTDVKDDDEEQDISEALNKEIAELKAQSKEPAAKRFQNADAGVKNVIFISTNVPDPLELALTIIKKLDETKQQKTRFLLRLIPIQIVCKANMADIKTTADKLFEKYFAQEPKTFAIVFNRHSNNKIQRTEIIEELAELISKKNPGNKADLKNPEIAVVVEVIRGFCLLSIAPEYFKYKKYNLMELCNIKESENSTKLEKCDAVDSTEPDDQGNGKEPDDQGTEKEPDDQGNEKEPVDQGNEKEPIVDTTSSSVPSEPSTKENDD